MAIDKISSLYNFVPLSKKVFFPDWAGLVSHDVPFEDGVSGELVCELATHTKVYVRNGGSWKDHDTMMREPEAHSFFYVKDGGDRRFVVPGTSLKGMVRSVLEIASFGKMSCVDDHRYGVRDLNNPNPSLYKDWMTETVRPKVYRAKAKAGWMVRTPESNGWKIVPCEYARVEQNDLVQFRVGSERIKKKCGSLDKYALWGWSNLSVTFDTDGEQDHDKHSCGTLRYAKAANLGKGSKSGTLVFTGQPAENRRGVPPPPGKREDKSSKHLEFIFFDSKEDSGFPVGDRVKSDFEFIHSSAKDVPNEEWKHWKGELEVGHRVPVFYLTEKNGSLKAVGLALMFRLPYELSVHQAIENSTADHFHGEPDLAETVFGFVSGDADALKGRVSFSPATAIEAKPVGDNAIQVVFGGPKPTFYPNYIVQSENLGAGSRSNYSTFMDPDCQIRGWKRYPVRSVAEEGLKKMGDKVDTRLIPLAPAARFRFSVKIHNLRPVELGAVVWALTWGGSKGHFHSLGMGKSAGFGRASVSILEEHIVGANGVSLSLEAAMSEFEKRMDAEVGGEWRKTEQLEQLLAMADPTKTPAYGTLILDPENRRNDFADAKRANLVLKPHVARSKIAPPTIVTETEVWERAKLVDFNPGTKVLKASSEDGKTKAEGKVGEGGLVVDEAVLTKVKKKPVAAKITVEKLGNRIQIVKVEVGSM